MLTWQHRHPRWEETRHGGTLPPGRVVDRESTVSRQRAALWHDPRSANGIPTGRSRPDGDGGPTDTRRHQNNRIASKRFFQETVIEPPVSTRPLGEGGPFYFSSWIEHAR